MNIERVPDARVEAITFPSLPELKPAEVDMALQLIEQNASEFVYSDHTDGYAMAVKTILAEKMSGKSVSKRVKSIKPTVDGDYLMAALKACWWQRRRGLHETISDD